MSAREIAARLDQIRFNATLNTELEALKYGKMLGASEKLLRLRIGRISAEEQFEGLAEESAANLDWEFLERLKRAGRALGADLAAVLRRVPWDEPRAIPSAPAVETGAGGADARLARHRRQTSIGGSGFALIA
jgi:hypothetical protein